MSPLSWVMKKVSWFPLPLSLIRVWLTSYNTATVLPSLELCRERRVTPFWLIEGGGNYIDLLLALCMRTLHNRGCF
jgi:hypothetical protein